MLYYGMVCYGVQGLVLGPLARAADVAGAEARRLARDLEDRRDALPLWARGLPWSHLELDPSNKFTKQSTMNTICP